MVPTPENSGPRTRFQIHSTGAILLDVTRQPTWMHSAADLKSSAVRAGASRAQHGTGARHRCGPGGPGGRAPAAPCAGPGPGPRPAPGRRGWRKAPGWSSAAASREGHGDDTAPPATLLSPSQPRGLTCRPSAAMARGRPRRLRRRKRSPARCAASALPGAPPRASPRQAGPRAARVPPRPFSGPVPRGAARRRRDPVCSAPCPRCSASPLARQRGFAFAMRSLPVG